MNKLTKGSLAAGAGIVLLLGGTGTFMSWNDKAEAGAESVTAGHLTVDTVASTGAWTVNGNPVTDITAYPIVPGDTVVYTTDLTVSAEGDNLQATVGVTPGSISAANDQIAADVALAAELDETATIVLATDNTGTLSVTDPENDGTYLVDAGQSSDTATMTATVTIKFPGTTADQNAAQNGAVTLANMAVELTQVI